MGEEPVRKNLGRVGLAFREPFDVRQPVKVHNSRWGYFAVRVTVYVECDVNVVQLGVR